MISGTNLRRLLAAVATLAAGAAVTLAAPAAAQAQAATGTRAASPHDTAGHATVSRLAPAKRGDVQRSCAGTPGKGRAACLALYLTNVSPHLGRFTGDSVPAGYAPADLQAAYGLPSASAGKGQTVALVDAYDDPDAATDLAVYRAQYGLPPCTTANRCFRKVNETGGTSYPAPNASWAQETSLDLDMVSAACPHCHILLVEADSNSLDDLSAAVDEAVALGAKFVSNSYGAAEAAGLGQAYNGYYNHPGVAVVAAAGDDGYGVQYPAASSYVTAVGGTSLTRSDATRRGWAETVWNNSYGGTGSGCSVDEVKPSWQADTGCANRTVADVSAEADPATGVAVYDSYQFQGWDQFGGTSVAAPLITAAYALAGTPAAGTYPASYPYADPSALNDVTTGANGACTPDYLCTAGPGYDGPSGLGTPDGVAAFTTPTGQVTGTITNAATGKPMKGVQVSTGATTSTTTNAHGGYTLALPPGSYTLTATGYAYDSATTSVTIADGGTATTNLALTPQPTVTISGQITDGSGHGWPLYARVSASGVPGQVYTNPYTGDYSITVLSTASYTLTATPAATGYQTASQQITVDTSNVTQNIAVPASLAGTTCTAPGYTSKYATAYSQGFDGTTIPAGWSATNTRSWVFDDPGQRGNLTGGSGGFAVADPVAEGGLVSSNLYSPVLNLSADPDPVLSFDTYDTNNLITEVKYSTDGGNSWTTLTEDNGDTPVVGSEPTDLSGPGAVSFSLPQAGGSTDVQLEFSFIGNSGFWEIDNFSIANLTCRPTPGGLVAGVVKDANTGAGLAGASVTSTAEPSESATTMAAPGGFYELFAAGRGRQSFTISDAGGYAAQAMTVRIEKNGIARADAGLQAGDLRLVPAKKLATTLVSGTAVTVPVTITNTGTVPATFTLTPEGDDGSDMAWLSDTPASGQIPADGSTTVQVTMTSGDATGTGQPGSYTGSLVVGTDTPYTPSVDVAMTVKPPAGWGRVTGTVLGATCDGGTTPLADVTVEITAAGTSYSLLTGDQGTYSWWLPQPATRATAIAALNGWQAQIAKARVKAGRTTTVNFTLQPATSCGALRSR